jgi:hypothetical protein
MTGPALQDAFLEACKAGDLATVQAVLAQGCPVNCAGGWGLRRAVRYSHRPVWQALLACRDIQVGRGAGLDCRWKIFFCGF